MISLAGQAEADFSLSFVCFPLQSRINIGLASGVLRLPSPRQLPHCMQTLPEHRGCRGKPWDPQRVVLGFANLHGDSDFNWEFKIIPKIRK